MTDICPRSVARKFETCVFYCGMLIKHHYDALIWNINSILKNWLIIIVKKPFKSLDKWCLGGIKNAGIPGCKLISMLMHSRPTSARDWIQHLYDSERLLLETWHSTARHWHATAASPGRPNAQLQNVLKNKIKIAPNMVWRMPREVFCIWFWKFPWRFLSVWTRAPSPGSGARSPLPCPRTALLEGRAGGRGAPGAEPPLPAGRGLQSPAIHPWEPLRGHRCPAGSSPRRGSPGWVCSPAPLLVDTTCTRAGGNNDPVCWQSAARPYITEWRWGREPRNEILIQKFKRDHSLRHAWWRYSPVSPTLR